MSGRAEVSTGQDPKEEVVVMEMGQTRWGGAAAGGLGWRHGLQKLLV